MHKENNQQFFSQSYHLNVDYILGKAHACVVDVVFSKMTEGGNSGRRIVKEIVIIVFFVHTKYSRCFVKLWFNLEVGDMEKI